MSKKDETRDPAQYQHYIAAQLEQFGRKVASRIGKLVRDQAPVPAAGIVVLITEAPNGTLYQVTCSHNGATDKDMADTLKAAEEILRDRIKKAEEAKEAKKVVDTGGKPLIEA